MKYAIRFSTESKNELKQIMRFWTYKDKRQRVRTQIKDVVQTLQDGIVSYPLVEFEPWRSRGIRRAVAGEYNIFYQMFPEDKKVIVLHVIHSARDLSKFL